MSLLFPLVSCVLIFSFASYVPFDFHVFESRHQCWRGHASVSFYIFMQNMLSSSVLGNKGCVLRAACACACIIIKNKRKEKGKKHTYYIIGKQKKKLIIKLEFKDV
jgi:hypothetical protein